VGGYGCQGVLSLRELKEKKSRKRYGGRDLVTAADVILLEGGIQRGEYSL